MDFYVKHGPVFSILEFKLDESEVVIAQPGSMLSMTSGLDLKAAVGRTGQQARWWSGFKNVIGGENFFTAEFTARKDSQTLILAPNSYGDILQLPLKDSGGFYLTRGAYLASAGSCDLKIKYGGMKGLMAKTGLFLLHTAGDGTVFCQTYGAIIDKNLAAGENFYIDNRFVVAFADTIAYQLVKATKSVKDAMMSGEGLVNRFTGPGKLFYQTRPKPSVSFLGYLLNAAT